MFLLLIGLANLVVLAGIFRVFLRMRRGRVEEADLEAQLNQRGLVGRLAGRATGWVRKPWHMMCLLDTADGVLMLHAYGWANARPVRKVFYNLTVTGLSVAVALLIGGIELIGVLADKLGITTGPLAAIAAVDLGDVGYLVVGVFITAWLLAVAVWKLGRVEERWSS